MLKIAIIYLTGANLVNPAQMIHVTIVEYAKILMKTQILSVTADNRTLVRNIELSV